MNAPYSGSCLCGSVTYTCHTDPKFSILCQCWQCQKITGSGHSAQFAVDATETKINGTVKNYLLQSDAGNTVESAFCPQCGNPIYKTTSMMPDTYVFHASTLDKAAEFNPQMVVYSGSAQPWDHVDPQLERK